MKIVLLGPTGQVGWELQRALAPLGELLLLGRKGLLRDTAAGSTAESAAGIADCGDLAQTDALLATLRRLRPDVVVNAAAYTAVDRAEAEPELAQTVNAQSPAALAALMAERGGWLLHYSSDYVFDGSGSHARSEDDPTGPLNVYGRSKLAGEAAIRASGCRHLILRTSWVHGSRGANFARTMLRLAAERDTLTVVDDQVGAPTGADLLADISAHALRQAWQQPSVSGTYHAVAGGAVSWCGYARHVLARAQQAGVALKAGPDQVLAVPSSAYPTPAARPLNSRLDTRRLQQSFGLRLPDWRLGLDRLLAQWLPTP